jgi:tight adherence protein B
MDALTLILMIGSGAALILLVIGVVISISSSRTLVEERLGRYIENEQQYTQIT